ncbi:hypothetical protein [Curtobacterium sp. PhB115]|uniref:hypothetical protein n=1 Tax=Curtobacterium sp. PhB115 TaxID=2485173 RepID=UPI000FB24057|nr:hypothetical protein [Curtobacterium sp. PhB115]ROP58653.1 hypothetical protein EDF19_3685 [Curtobacterium sp. PhB115]
MTAVLFGTTDRSLDSSECWSLLARTPSARLAHGTLSPVTVVAIDRERQRITVDLGATVCEQERALLEIGGQGAEGGWNVIAVVRTGPITVVSGVGLGVPLRRTVLDVVEVGGIVFARDAHQGAARAVMAA